MNYLGLKKREAMEQILGCRAYEQTAHIVAPQEKAETGNDGITAQGHGRPPGICVPDKDKKD